MKTLLNANDSAEIAARIHNLSVDANARWGKMNVSQMFAHLQGPLRIGLQEVKLRQSLVGMLFGRLVLKKFLSDEPWRRGMPTDKTFIVSEPREFNQEKDKLLELIGRFNRVGPGGISKYRHPFFGKLSPEEWGRLMWTHINHHLKQFGA